jgi:hypothetical protein
MKTAAGLLVLFFFISVAVLVLNERPVHAGRVLKRNIMSKQTHKNPSDHPNLLIEEVDAAPSGPNPGGNKNTQSKCEGLNYVHVDKLNTQFQKDHVLPCGQRLSKLVDGDRELGDILNGKLPSAALPGVGHKYIISFGPLKMKTSNAAISASTSKELKINKLPSGPSAGVGHKFINVVDPMNTSKLSVKPAQTFITTTTFNKLPSGPSDGVGHKYFD